MKVKLNEIQFLHPIAIEGIIKYFEEDPYELLKQIYLFKDTYITRYGNSIESIREEFSITPIYFIRDGHHKFAAAILKISGFTKGEVLEAAKGKYIRSKYIADLRKTEVEIPDENIIGTLLFKTESYWEYEKELYQPPKAYITKPYLHSYIHLNDKKDQLNIWRIETLEELKEYKQRMMEFIIVDYEDNTTREFENPNMDILKEPEEKIYNKDINAAAKILVDMLKNGVVNAVKIWNYHYVNFTNPDDFDVFWVRNGLVRISNSEGGSSIVPEDAVQSMAHRLNYHKDHLFFEYDSEKNMIIIDFLEK